MSADAHTAAAARLATLLERQGHLWDEIAGHEAHLLVLRVQAVEVADHIRAYRSLLAQDGHRRRKDDP